MRTQTLQGKNARCKKILVFLPAAAIAAAIFFFSSQPADGSTMMSDSVSRILLHLFSWLGITKPTDGQAAGLLQMLSTPVRKGAHITEFTALYLSVAYGLRHYIPRHRDWLLAALAATFFYACTDEFHQLFVPGRSGQFTDVLVDCIGGAVITVAGILAARRAGQKHTGHKRAAHK